MRSYRVCRVVYNMESMLGWSQTVLLLLVFVLALYCTRLLRRVDEGLDCMHDSIHFIESIFTEHNEDCEGDDELSFPNAVVISPHMIKNFEGFYNETEAFWEKHGRAPQGKEIREFDAFKKTMASMLEEETPAWKKWEQQD